MGYFDIFNVNRNAVETAKWWKHDTTKEWNETVQKEIPTAVFKVEQVSSTAKSEVMLGGSYEHSNLSTTLKTSYKLNGMRKNDLIKWRDKWWKVISTQEVPNANSLQLTKNYSYDLYIEIKGIDE